MILNEIKEKLATNKKIQIKIYALDYTIEEQTNNIVIYANQLTRSAFPEMEQTAKDILRYHRAKEVDSRLMPIKDIISLIDEL